MEKRKKASLTFSVIAIALMVSMAAGLFMQRSGLAPKSYIVFATGSTPDEYGNKIHQLDVLQKEGIYWYVVVHITEVNYTSGMTAEIDSNMLTKLRIQVYINKTLVTDCTDAVAKTRVYLNISTVFTNQLMSYTGGCEGAGDYWAVTYESTSWTPVTDTAYDVAVKYEAYY